LSFILLLSVIAVSFFALIGFTKPAQGEVGSHYITAVYYQAYVHDDHDADIVGIKNPGDWRFGLKSAVQDYTWTGEISVDGARMVDFPDRGWGWYITGNTWFKCRAEEWDGAGVGSPLGWVDYGSDVTVNVAFPGTPVNTWHYGSFKQGDVTHYYGYYIHNLDPTANPINNQFVAVGVPVSFSGSGTDPEGDSLSYEWNFGDGTTSTEQTPTHIYTDVGTYTVSFRVKDYFGAYDYKYATVTVTKVIIDQTFVSDTRCDVGSTQTVGFHAKWAHDNASIVGGSIYVSGTEHVTNGTGWISFNTTAYNTVGKRMWSVTGVNCNGITLYGQNVTDPYIVWDQLEIYDYGVSDGRCDVGTAQTVWMKARYDYDDEVFDDSKGYLSIGGIAATWDAGNGYWYITVSKNTVTKVDYPSPSRFTDTTYALATITGSVTQSIIWDKVTVTLSAVDDTVEVGSTASVTQTAVYQYDGTDFDGTITLNDTLTKSTVGTYYYTTQSISGDTYGITKFESNTIPITFVDTTAPMANAGPDQTVNEDTAVAFSSTSTDAVGIISHTWTFTDVTPQTLTGINPTYTFATPGTYTVTLTVADAAGNHATDTIVITVLDITKPVANAGSDQTVTADTSVSFDASNSTDNMAIVSYEWDFGDGTTGTGKTTTHTYTEPGTYNVTLTVKDAADNSKTDSITITVEAAPTVFPWWVLGVVGAVIAAGIVVTMLLLWRRKASKGS